MAKKPINDGGPAFPSEWSTFEYRGDPAYCGPTRVYHSVSGMSLRDWLAGMAMLGMLAHSFSSSLTREDIAEEAGRQADAMLQERDRKEESHG